jgi:hydroxymethylbilane synthase
MARARHRVGTSGTGVVVIERWSVVGFTRGADPQASRALPALSREAWAQRLRRRLDAERFRGGFALVTCERVELVRVAHAALDERDEPRLVAEAVRFFAGDSAAGAVVEPALRVLRGRAAILHLLRIPAGLDSRLVGEEEIAGQWRGALDAARRERTLSDEIERLARWEARTTRRARLALAAATGSLAERAVRAATTALHGADPDRRWRGARVGLVGTGELARDLAARLQAQADGAPDLVFYGRHVERTTAVARHFGGAARDRQRLRDDLARLDAVFLVTRSRQPVLDAADVGARPRPLVAVDLGEPPLLHDCREGGGDAPVPLDRLLTIDLALLSATAGSARHPAVAAAERIVEGEVDRWLARRVVLAAHGEGDGSVVNRRVGELAARVEELTAVPTEAAFRLGSPSWSHLPSDPPHEIVPLLAAQGHFHREVLTRAFADAHRVAVQRPIGEHPAIRRGLVERVRREVVRFTARGGPVAILLAAHGTERHRGSGSAAAARGRALARHFPAQAVAVGYLDQSPSIEDATRDLTHGTHHGTLLVVPWFLGGAHVREDLPGRVRAALGELAAVERGTADPACGRACDGTTSAWTAVDLQPLLDEPALLPALLDRVGRSADRHVRPLRLGSRGSALALSQAELVRRLLGERGVAARVVVVDTVGDRERERPIADFPTAGPFTDDLERALREERIDVAVHSLKDVPLGTDDDPELELVALLERGPAADVLVVGGAAREERSRTLDTLRRGARIGTCSDRRRLQVSELRRDLVVEPIRGTIERRVAQLDAGRFDALILAEAAFVRLGWGDRVASRLPIDRLLPEPGQAVIALQMRRDPAAAARADVAALSHPPTVTAAGVERELARRFDGPGTLHGCLAAHADFHAGALRLRTRWFPSPGARPIEAALRRAIDPVTLPTDTARRIADGAEQVLRQRRSLEALEHREGAA